MDCQQRNPGSLKLNFPPRTIQKSNAIHKEELDKLIAMLKQISGLTEKCKSLEAIENNVQKSVNAIDLYCYSTLDRRQIFCTSKLNSSTLVRLLQCVYASKL